MMILGQSTWALNLILSLSFEAPKLAIPVESGTFQDSAVRLFNILPDKLRHKTDYHKFVRLMKNFLKQRAYDW